MISFRNALLSDLEELTALHTPETETKQQLWMGLQWKRIQDSGENKNKEFVVAVKDGKIVGNVLIDYNGGKNDKSCPYVEGLLVLEDLRNQGVGTEIIKECEKRILAKGYKKVGISVNPDNNVQAQKLYERLGYVATSIEKYLDFVDPYDGVEDWVIDMVKVLE